MINVAVVYGGRSTEHDVSIISALQAIENIDKKKYNVIPTYMSKEGDFYVSKNDYLLEAKNYRDEKTLIKNAINVSFIKIKNKTYLRENDVQLFKKGFNELIDVAFPIVHGTNVEDGNLQGFFHTLNLPLVGPDCLSAAVSMDKYVMKEYCKSIFVPVIEALRFDKNDFEKLDETIKCVEAHIKYPVIVKPVNLGSSIGIKKAYDTKSLKDALTLSFTFTNVILVEKAIENMREINCAVLGDKFDCETSLLEEPFGNDEILSFADKYMSGAKGGGAKGAKLVGAKVGSKTSNPPSGAKGGMASLKRKVPAELPKDIEDEIKNYATKIFKYIGCSGVARIDFIIDKDTGKVYANEINPIPGSLSYYLFEPMGLKYEELLDKLINIALNNYRLDNKLNYSFSSSIL